MNKAHKYIYHRIEMNLQIVRFGVVGVIGFFIDSAVLYISLYYFELGYYFGRLISYLCAATVAWYLHRIFTFKDAQAGKKHRQLVSFQITNSLGGGANYIIYALLVMNQEIFRKWPVLAVGIGAVIGMFINYYLSKKVVFKS